MEELSPSSASSESTSGELGRSSPRPLPAAAPSSAPAVSRRPPAAGSPGGHDRDRCRVCSQAMVGSLDPLSLCNRCRASCSQGKGWNGSVDKPGEPRPPPASPRSTSCGREDGLAPAPSPPPPRGVLSGIPPPLPASGSPVTLDLSSFLHSWQEQLLASVNSLVSSQLEEFGGKCVPNPPLPAHPSPPGPEWVSRGLVTPPKRRRPPKDDPRRIKRSRPSVVVAGSLSPSRVRWEGRDDGRERPDDNSSGSLPSAAGDGRGGSSIFGPPCSASPPTGRLAQAFSGAATSVHLAPRGSVTIDPPVPPKPTTMRRGRDALFSLPCVLRPGPRG